MRNAGPSDVNAVARRPTVGDGRDRRVPYPLITLRAHDELSAGGREIRETRKESAGDQERNRKTKGR